VSPELKAFELLAELSEDERELVADMLERHQLEAGEQLFCEGQEAEGLVLVESGALALSSARAGELGQIEAGDCLGVASLVAVGPRESTAVAAGASCVWVLSRESFRRLAEDAPRAACRILEGALADLASAVRDGLDRFGGPPPEA
jgi:CRP-like cAMP-binding protein